MKNSIAIIDGNNYAHRAYHAYSRFSYKGQSTSVVFGMTKMVIPVLLANEKVIVVWDGHRSSERLKIHPDYKAHRNEKLNFDANDFYRQREIMMSILDSMGIIQLYDKDLEGDDLLYVAVKHYKKCCIYSADKDFNQILKHKSVSIYNPNLCKYYNYKNIEKYFPYKAEETVDYLSLLGDSSDNIPGYKGLGPKKIRLFLDEFKSIKDYLKSDKEYKGVDKQTMLEVYRKNKSLISLSQYNKRFLLDYKISSAYIKKPSLVKPNVGKFNEYCSDYNMNSILSDTRIYKILKGKK